MELALPERFDTRQALRYLGISAEEPDSATRALLRRAERTLRAAAGPRAVAVRAARDDISPYLQGNDILRHLEGCGSCVLLACYGCFGRGRSSGDGPSCGLRKLCAA